MKGNLILGKNSRSLLTSAMDAIFGEEDDTVHLAGTFATINGFTASDEDLLAGMSTTKVRMRFFIDEAAKKPEAILLRVPEMTEVDPREFRGGFQIDRQLGFDMDRAWRANKSRSRELGFRGTGNAMGYTTSVEDNTSKRAYVVGRKGLRETCERFTLAESWPSDYKEHGRIVRTAAQQESDWVLIQQYCDQHGI